MDGYTRCAAAATLPDPWMLAQCALDVGHEGDHKAVIEWDDDGIHINPRAATPNLDDWGDETVARTRSALEAVFGENHESTEGER